VYPVKEAVSDATGVEPLSHTMTTAKITQPTAAMGTRRLTIRGAFVANDQDHR